MSTISKTRRMALVPEETLATLAAEKRATQSPYIRSLANMDLEMQAIFQDPNIPLSRKLVLYERVADRYRNILKQYKSQVPYVRVLKLAKKKRPRPQVPPAVAVTPPPAVAVAPRPAIPEEEEEDEEDEIDETVLPPSPPTIGRPPAKRRRVPSITRKPMTRSRLAKKTVKQKGRGLGRGITTNWIRY